MREYLHSPAPALRGGGCFQIVGACVFALVLACGCGGGDDDSTTGGTGGTGGAAGNPQVGTGGSTPSSGSGGSGTGQQAGGSGGSSGAVADAGANSGNTGSGGTGTDAGQGQAVDGGGAAASDAGTDAGAGSTGAFSIQSTAFADGTTIDAKYRCTGPSPDLAWSGAPAGTKSFAIVFKDITPAGTNGFDSAGTIHWVIYDIPPDVSSLPEGVAIGYMPDMPSGAKQAPNYNMQLGFNGPCYPLPASTATYQLTLYAIDVDMLPGLSMSSANADVISTIEAHQLASASLTIMSTT